MPSQPFTWAEYVVTLLHEFAYCTVALPHAGHPALFRAALRRLAQTAREGARDTAEPGDVADLFAVTTARQERSGAVFAITLPVAADARSAAETVA